MVSKLTTNSEFPLSLPPNKVLPYTSWENLIRGGIHPEECAGSIRTDGRRRENYEARASFPLLAAWGLLALGASGKVERTRTRTYVRTYTCTAKPGGRLFSRSKTGRLDKGTVGRSHALLVKVDFFSSRSQLVSFWEWWSQLGWWTTNKLPDPVQKKPVLSCLVLSHTR